MMRDNNKKTTFSAYERFDVDGDVRHINTMLTELAPKSKLFSNILRVDKFTEADRDLMENKFKLTPDFVTAIINDAEHNKSYVKYTNKGGDYEFGDLDALKSLTGYTADYATKQEIARQNDSRELALIASLGYSILEIASALIRSERAPT